jgi:hypothetical protein
VAITPSRVNPTQRGSSTVSTAGIYLLCHSLALVPIRESTRSTPSRCSYGEGVDDRRRLAPSPFPGDEGRASAQTRELLAIVNAQETAAAYLRAVASLCGDRILVPVVATATRLGQTTGGLTSDKEGEMAVVLLQAHNGRRAMLGFTGLDSLQAWQAETARPVPVTLDIAARTARAEGAVALVIDIAGPDSLVIEGEVLDKLAAGHRLLETEPDVFGWAIPADPRL